MSKTQRVKKAKTKGTSENTMNVNPNVNKFNDEIWAITPAGFEDFCANFATTNCKSDSMPNASYEVDDDDNAVSADAQASSGVEITDDGIVVIHIGGTIIPSSMSKNTNDGYDGQCPIITQETIKDCIVHSLSNPACNAICLAVHSPGGVAAGIEELAGFIAKAATEKPIFAWVDGLCASAAYWIASATGCVIARSSATVGSIGVICVHDDISKMLELNGIDREYLTAGSKKAVGAPKPLSDDDRAYIQAQLDHIYANFTRDVAQNMALSINDAEKWADGQVFFGDQAEQLGLVTAIMPEMPTLSAILTIKGDAPMSKEAEKQATQATPDTTAEDTVAKIRTECLSVVKAILGEAAAEKIKAVFEAGLTGEQIEKCKVIFGQKTENPEKPEGEDKPEGDGEAPEAPEGDGDGEDGEKPEAKKQGKKSEVSAVMTETEIQAKIDAGIKAALLANLPTGTPANIDACAEQAKQDLIKSIGTLKA